MDEFTVRRERFLETQKKFMRLEHLNPEMRDVWPLSPELLHHVRSVFEGIAMRLTDLIGRTTNMYEQNFLMDRLRVLNLNAALLEGKLEHSACVAVFCTLNGMTRALEEYEGKVLSEE